MARLRELFDDPLLIRANKGMQLTCRAEELVEPLRHWLAHTDSLFARGRFDPAAVNRRFRIASTDFGVTAVIAPALARLHGQAPGVVVDTVAFTDGMFGKLASGEIDLILSGLDPDHSLAYSRRLFTMTSCCLMRAGHPLAAGKGRISIEQFLAWPHISILVGEHGFDRVAALLGARAGERRVIATTPYFEAAQAMLGASDALLLLPTPLARSRPPGSRASPRFAVRPAPALFPPLDYRLLWHERNRRDPATMWLVEQLAESCAVDCR